MSKRFAMLITLFFVVHVAFSQWIKQKSGTSTSLYQVQMLDDQIGYVSGNNGTLLKTINGGVDWKLVPANFSNAIKWISFLTPNVGFIHGAGLLKTVDGGNSWIQCSLPDTVKVEDIFFIDGNNGFLACLDSGLYKTVDGAQTWSRVSTKGCRAVYFPTPSVGFASHGFAGISKSIDGGLTWELIHDQSSPPNADVANVPECIHCTSEDNCFFGSTFYGGIYRTQDAGNTVDFQHIPTGNIHFPSEDVGYLLKGLTTLKTIMQTKDGGDTWEEVYQSDKKLYDIWFSSNTSGWAVGENGTILRYGNNPVGAPGTKIDELNVSIYPNPASNSITIDLSEQVSILQVEILSALGSRVAIINSPTNKINVSRIQSGIYMIRICTDQGIFNTRLVKE